MCFKREGGAQRETKASEHWNSDTILLLHRSNVLSVPVCCLQEKNFDFYIGFSV